MPIILDSPEQVGAPIVVKEVVGFSVDLEHWVLTFAIDGVDANGKTVNCEPKKSRLLNPDGSPRFTEQERAMLKAAIYRIGSEDGHLPAGEVI